MVTIHINTNYIFIEAIKTAHLTTWLKRTKTRTRMKEVGLRIKHITSTVKHLTISSQQKNSMIVSMKSSSRQSQMQHCWKSNLNCPRLFCCSPSRLWRYLPDAPMVPTPCTSQTPSKSPLNVQHGTTSLCLCYFPRPTQFYEAPIHPNRLPHQNPQGTQQESCVGIPTQLQDGTWEHQWATTDVPPSAKSTRLERVSNTIFFKHTYLTQPTV